MRLAVTPSRLVVAPGDVVRLELTVHNDGEESLLPEVAVRGVQPAMVLHQDTGVELLPGQEGVARIDVQVPADAIAGELPIAISVADADGLHEPGLVAVDVEVGRQPPVSVEVEPATAHGRRAGRIDTILRNHGTAPLDLRLTGISEGVDVRFASDRVWLDVGEALAVPTRLRRTGRTWFRELRHGVLLDVRDRGAPVTAAATFVQRPLFPPLLRKATAVLAILGLWAGLVVVVGTRMQRADQELAAAESEGLGAPDEDGADGDDGDAGGEDPAPDDGGDGDEAGEEAAPGAAVVVVGEVAGPRDPAGTRIIVERISFGDEGTTGEGTKLAALTPVALPVATVVERIETETDERGRFALSSGLSTSAFYRVSAIRAGFEVASSVVRTEEEAAEHEVLLALVPAPGAMSGRVTSTDGTPIGGAEVLISGGDLTYRTITASETGTWSLEGLAAAPAYGVTFRAPRFASATVVRSLEGGQQLADVDAQLAPDLGTIRGLLSHRGEGVGGISVELTGDGVERSTTTLTAGGLEGTFDLPALPFGTYQLTFSAPGWLTQTTEVVVDRGDVELRVGDLQPATAVVQGVVQQEVTPGGCAYPDPADPTARDQAVPTPCGGVGVRLVGDTGTFSTTTATGTGSFTLSGIPPGTYTAAFERFGYVSQHLQVELAAGDVLTLPDGAVGGGGTAALRTASAGTGAAAVIMRLVPPVTQSVGQLQGVLRSGTDPAAAYEPPPGTEVEAVDQPEAEVELLAEGGIRITGLVPGAVTVRVRAPGHDEFTAVVRVGGTTLADAGTMLLTPLATLALRVTDGQEFPINGADVFLTAGDPADADDLVLDPAIDPGVTACTVARDVAGRWRITDAPSGEVLEGLCARVDAAGDVSFRQAVGTGSYRLITPVNQVDVAAVDDPSSLTPAERAARSRVVPLDHQQLERLVEVRSGETSRLDLRARRYAVIEGRIRKPSGAGFLNATAADFVVGATDGLAAFPELASFVDGTGATIPLGVGLHLQEDGSPVTPPEGLRPRIAFGPADGLPEGVYRINRVLPAEIDLTRDYELEFFGADGGNFGYRGTNALAALAFGETRVANAVLLPTPVEVEVRVLRVLRDGTAVPVQDVEVSATGIVEFVYDSGGLLPIVEPSSGVTGADGIAVLRNASGAVQPYLESQVLEVSTDAVGFEPLAVERTVPTDGTLDLFVTPVLRTIRGAVELVPTAASVDPPLGTLDLALDVVGADPPETMTAGLQTQVVGDQLLFTIGEVPPGPYRLVVSGDDVFDTTSAEFDVPTGPAGEVVAVGPGGAATSPPPFLVDREVDLTVDVTESFTDVGETSPSTLDVKGATVRLLLDGVEVAAADTDADGEVLFEDLRGGPTRSYHLEIAEPGYTAPAGTEAPFTLDAALTTATRSLVRFGSVQARITSYVSDDDPEDGLKGATVTVLDTAGDPVPGVPDFPSDDDGHVVVPATTELAAGSYQLHVTAPDHDPATVPVTIADATVTDVGDIRLQRTRAGITGTVTDDSAGNPPLPHVRVRATKDGTDATIYAEDVTGADGTYALADLPPRPMVLVFEEFADAAETIPTSRRVHEVTVNPKPGEALVEDLLMARRYVAISGAASSRDFDHPDAPTASLVGATVTATCVAGACTGATPTVLTTATGPGGSYEFDVVNAGTYELVFSADGHDTPAARMAVVVRFDDDLSTVTVDQVLVATPIEVPVTALSSGFGGLSGIDVTATYVAGSVGDPVPSTATDARFVLSATTGAAGEPAALVLPPGEWTLATTDATAATTSPRPHRDGTDGLVLAAADPTSSVDLVLEPYVEVSGSVRSRPHTAADSTLRAGASVVPTQQPGDPAHPVSAAAAATTGSDGAWAVLLPPTPGTGTTTWELAVDAAGHESAALDVDVAAGAGDISVGDGTPMTVRATGDLAPALHGGSDGIELTATPVAQPVVVTSQFDGAVLDDVTVRATWDGGGAPPPSDPAYLTETVSGSSAVELRLAPGSWVVTTVDAGTAAGLPDRAPHQDAPGTAVGPGIGSTPPTATLALVRWASITGDVQTLTHAGATPVSPTDATATVTDPATGIAEADSDADGVDGRWRVWIEDPADATVVLSKPGYVSVPVDVSAGAFTGRDLVLGTPVQLTAGERDVEVTVVSSVGGGGLEGVVVTATDPTGALAPRTAVTGSSGVATFDGADALAPVEWGFTTANGPTLTEPHHDLVAGDDVRRTVPTGSGTYTIDGTGAGDADERLTLTRYASVTGTVGTRDHAGDGLTLRDGVAMTALGPAGAIAEPTSGVDGVLGRWRVWLPDPDLTSLRFEFAGHAPVVLDVLAGSQRDITVSTPVSLVAVPRTVEVTVVSAADGTPLADVDVTATAPSPLAAVTARTGADGVARFTAATAGDPEDRRLAPADWTFTTDRATTLDPPHHDLDSDDDETRPIPAGTGTLALDSTVDDADDERLELERYASVTGTVSTEAYDGAAVVPSDSPTMTVTTPTSGAVVEEPGADGVTGQWRVWVPEPAAVAVDFSLTGYDDDTSQVGVGDFTDRDATSPDAVLRGLTRQVEVTVASSDGSLLGANIDVTATGPTGAPGPFTAATNGTGVAVFRNSDELAPTTWTFTTTGGAAHKPPHQDLTAAIAEQRTVPPGTDTLLFDQTTDGDPRERLTLHKYAVVEGIAATRAAAGAPETPSELVTVTETSSSGAVVESPADVTGETGLWRAWVPEGSDVTLEFTLTAHGTETRTYTAVTGSSTVADVVLTADPRPVTVTAVAAEDSAITFPGIDVTATGPGGTPVVGPVTTDANGVADLGSLAPLTYELTTSGADAVGRVDVVDADDLTREVTIGTDTLALELPLTLDALPTAITGEVIEYLNGTPVRVAGVVVTGTRGAESYDMSPSTDPASGDNYSLQLPAGTWRLTAEAATSGPTVVVDEAFAMPTDGTGSAPTVVMPTGTGADLTGTVTTGAGAGVEGATVTAVAGPQTRTTTTDADGDYTLVGLDPGVTWAVTYTPPSGIGGVPVTRFVAPGGSSADITLAQEVPAGLGSIQVDVTGGPPSTTVTVTLTETGPFPTIDADGVLEDTVALDASGAGSVTFSGLVPGDDTSIPHDRFAVTLDVAGHQPFSDGGNEVTAGGTTVVDAALVALAPPTRDVELTLSGPDGDVDDRTATLTRDTATINGTVPTGTNVYTFADVEADATWTLHVAGHEPIDVAVPAGTTLHQANVTLVPSTRAVELTLSDDNGTITTSSPAPTLTLSSDTISGTAPTTPDVAWSFADVRAGTWMLSVPGYVDTPVTVPEGTGTHTASVTLTPAPRAVVLTLDDGTDPVTGVVPELTRAGFSGVTGTESTTNAGEYTFAAVTPGDWSLVTAGHDTEPVSVPAGVGDHTDSVTLTATTP